MSSSSNLFHISEELSYDEKHWACNEPPFIVWQEQKDDFQIYVYVNPFDKRCWRLIVSAVPIINNKPNPKAILNLAPSHPLFVKSLSLCFGTATKMFSLISSQFGFIVQIIFAGNNAMSCYPVDGTKKIKLGNEEEPWLPHVHLIIRGCEGMNLLGHRYCGPAPGDIFDLRQGKVCWEHNDLLSFHSLLSSYLSSDLLLLI